MWISLKKFDFIVFWLFFLGFSGSWLHHYPWFDFLIGNSCKTFVENSRRVNRWLLDSFPISCWLKWILVFGFIFWNERCEHVFFFSLTETYLTAYCKKVFCFRNNHFFGMWRFYSYVPTSYNHSTYYFQYNPQRNCKKTFIKIHEKMFT